MLASNEKKNFIVSAVVSIIVIALCNSCAPGLITIGTWDLWKIQGDIKEWLMVSSPIFIWGVAVNLFFWAKESFGSARSDPARRMAEGYMGRFMRSAEPSGRDVLLGGFIISLMAGVLEEISFRWLIFLGSFAGLAILNWIGSGIIGILLCVFVGGLVGLILGSLVSRDSGVRIIIGAIAGISLGIAAFAKWGMPPGLPEWFHMHAFGPLADWVTFGKVHEFIFPATGWLAGAAMLYSNAFFRDGHKYQGPLGVVNSWFLGMYFFWIVFHYGLLAAILVHFLYDMLIFITAAIKQTVRVGF